MSENTFRSQQDTPLTYKVLLVCSSLITALFCWLYVTKPVTPIQETSKPNELENISQSTDSANQLPEDDTPITIPKQSTTSPKLQDTTDFLIPSETLLPGTTSKTIPLESTSPTSPLNQIPLANSEATNGSNKWEETNDRIQHVITAEDNDQSERIILEVPVIYQTRGLRLGPKQAEEARRILRALENYKNLVAKLHQDGKNISKAWDLLLLDSQPIDALRADSPSLPSKTLPTNSTPIEKSAATITIETK